jgi:hypothetical protein
LIEVEGMRKTSFKMKKSDEQKLSGELCPQEISHKTQQWGRMLEQKLEKLR